MSTAPSPTSIASRSTKLTVAGLIAGAVVVLAQVVEAWVLAARPHRAHLLGPLYLEVTFNRGSSFSLMAGGGWLPVLLAAAVTLAMAALLWQARSWGVVVGASMALGGGISNLIDRAHHGAVADYLWTSFWPTFNVADAAITVGVATALVGLLRGDQEHRGA